MKLKEKLKTKCLNVFIDAEWASDNRVICFQCMISDPGKSAYKTITFAEAHRALLLSKGYVEGYNQKIDGWVFFTEFSDDRSILSDLVIHYCEEHGFISN